MNLTEEEKMKFETAFEDWLDSMALPDGTLPDFCLTNMVLWTEATPEGMEFAEKVFGCKRSS